MHIVILTEKNTWAEDETENQRKKNIEMNPKKLQLFNIISRSMVTMILIDLWINVSSSSAVRIRSSVPKRGRITIVIIAMMQKYYYGCNEQQQQQQQ